MTGLLLACVLAVAQAGAASLEDACLNEIGVLCPGQTGAAAARCLEDNAAGLLKGCRAAVAAWRAGEEKRQAEARAKAAAERAAASMPAPSAGEARLIRTEGAVYVRTSLHEGRWLEGEAGMPLEPGDLVRTGADGSAEIAWNGDGLLILGPGGDLAIEMMGKDSVRLFLGFGLLAAKISKLSEGRSTQFASPAALVVVRGTELAMEQTASQARVAVLEEGRVSVSGAAGGAEVELKANHELEVHPGQAPEQPKPMASMKPHHQKVVAARKRHLEMQTGWKPRSHEERLQARRELAFKPATDQTPKVEAAHAQRTYPQLRLSETPARRGPRKGRAPQLGPTR